MKTKNTDPTATATGRKLGLVNIGCEELYGSYKGFQFFWTPKSGATRIHGNSKPIAFNSNLKDLLLWVLSHA